jgi:hypothetical protein
MATTIEQKLAALDAKRARLVEKMRSQERSDDTRRKILAGAWLLYRMENGDERLAEYFRQQFPGYLLGQTGKNQKGRERDLALFEVELANLPALTVSLVSATEPLPVPTITDGD